MNIARKENKGSFSSTEKVAASCTFIVIVIGMMVYIKIKEGNQDIEDDV